MKLADMLWADFSYKAQCFYGRSEPKDVARVCLSDGTLCMLLYRCAQGLDRIGLGLVAALALETMKLVGGCVIGRKTEFQEGFVMMHPVGVVINGGVRGGQNIVIESGVVIGSARNGLPVQVPRLGDDVFVGAGAKVLGGIDVGSHVRIGANAVVVHDVPDGATVVGIPARVVKVDQVLDA